MSTTTPVLRRGAEELPPGPVRLEAGDLVAELVGADLRAVQWRGREIVQRLYMAVRDAPWNTIPGALSHRQVVQGDGEFQVTWQQRHLLDDIDLTWHGRVRGTAEGDLEYEMDAVTGRAFRHSKIGLNVHHGLQEYLGRAYRARTQDGEVEGVLPHAIAPQLVEGGSLTAMFAHFDRIQFELDFARLVFDFEGDRFEMQDHRNWSDSNFKTYGTPLSFGFPMDVAEGERLRQRIVVKVDDLGKSSASDTEQVRLEPVVFDGDLPAIGHLVDELDASAGAVMAKARPRHLRLEVVADSMEERLSAVRDLTGGRTPIELVVALDPGDPSPEATRVADALSERSDDVARVVVLAAAGGFSEFKGATPAELPAAVSAALDERGIRTPVYSGTDQFFTELNRARPPYDVAGVVFSLNPQVHASDDRSLMENAGCLPHMAESARRLYPDSEVAVGPVHLVGPNGPFPAGPPSAAGTPAGYDVRHGALFGAAWTVAIVEGAVRAGIGHLTLYDLVGGRGLAPSGGQSAGPVATVTASGYPALWPIGLLAEVTGEAPSSLLLGAAPQSQCALVGVVAGPRTRLLVGNLTDRILDLLLVHEPGLVTSRVLDEATASAADLLAESDGIPATRTVTGQGRTPLLLRPYATACLDVTPG